MGKVSTMSWYCMIAATMTLKAERRFPSQDQTFLAISCVWFETIGWFSRHVWVFNPELTYTCVANPRNCDLNSCSLVAMAGVTQRSAFRHAAKFLRARWKPKVKSAVLFGPHRYLKVTWTLVNRSPAPMGSRQEPANVPRSTAHSWCSIVMAERFMRKSGCKPGRASARQ